MSAVDVHYTVDGPDTAPVVVLVNSLGTTLEMWDPQLASLSAEFRVVRFDMRGHGRSPVPQGPYSMADLGSDVVRLLDRLGVERAHVVGLSIGGMVGQWLGAHAPDRVAGLTLMCTAPRLEPASAWAQRAATVRAEGTEAIADTVVGRWFTPEFAEANPQTVARTRAMVAATPAEGYAGCCGAIEGADLVPDLPSVTAPTLVVAAAEDPSTPPGVVEQVSGGIPGARYVLLEDSAHLVNVQRDAAVTQLVSDHVHGKTPE
ncbi:3-oxoadipate enol-lactonase [Lipingzhangella sp. LS1_29]|uniref:3-oxoadipate enol-lactonase n=1 Tax=Lipingzhangella rawalii TaxID=2055835 RepID=A0ABU2H7G5_9ACTN|nr:3-oxoadipate enol-lactonase [Lipingzhangella rawalii]MDS1271240.1 3-oxoadipate enol-lactonase [Lipingzhangella rawalii]